MSKKLAEIKARIDKNLDCTIEHLDGAHEGKVVVRRDVFESAYDAACALSRLIARMPAKMKDSPGASCVQVEERNRSSREAHNKLRQTIINIICEEMK